MCKLNKENEFLKNKIDEIQCKADQERQSLEDIKSNRELDIRNITELQQENAKLLTQMTSLVSKKISVIF